MKKESPCSWKLHGPSLYQNLLFFNGGVLDHPVGSLADAFAAAHGGNIGFFLDLFQRLFGALCTSGQSLIDIFLGGYQIFLLRDLQQSHVYEGWMRSLKALFPDAKANSAAMAEKFRHYRTLIAERTSNLSDAQRRTVLFIVRTDARQLVVSGEKFFGEYWAKAVGAKNAAHELKAENANAVVTMESIYAWNPDIVLLTNFTPLQPNDLIEGRDAGRDWTSVKAVKDGRVYKMPLGLYRSFTPTADTPLTLLWLAKTIYPERFADIDLQAETEHFYRDVFGLSLTEAQIKTIYAPQARASVGLTGSVRSSR